MGVNQSFSANPLSEKKPHVGLSEKEARKKYEKHGPNALTQKKRISAVRILLSQFNDFMVLILMASTIISAFMSEMTEAITILAIIVVNAILGFIQEYRTEKTMEALKNLAAPTAKVIREGSQVSIPAEQVVPGDVLLFEAGDRIAADCTLLEASSLQLDEALLTGESVPVEKSIKGLPKTGQSIGDQKNRVFMGTIVTRGRGTAVVDATGMSTEMGHIAGMIQEIQEEDTPLQRRLDHFGKFLVFGCLAICAVVSVTGILRGEALFTMLLAGISLAVAAVPEGLPALVTIALALGVQRMLKRNALIRKLPAVETLGCASVICSDKTGTLTENKMTVRKLYAAGCLAEVKGSGDSMEGGFYIGGREIHPQKNQGLQLTLEIGALCNNAEIREKSGAGKSPLGKIKALLSRDDKVELLGDPTESALLVAAAKAGLTSDVLGRNYFRVGEIPFDSDRKCMSVICDNHKGETFVFTKGAPDIILDKCTKIITSKGVVNLDPALRRELLRMNEKMAGEALRVLGMGYKKLDSRTFNQRVVEKDLIFVGLQGMIDPPRMEVLDAVQKCKLAGIKPVMITGDHQVTAAAIARELTIYSEGDGVLTGDQLSGMDETKLEQVVDDVTVYARVSPKHKLMIVRALKKRGHVVAMTGDGVNDAPAVKEADIGVSMGKTGTDVTKEASAMILLDDNFATIVAAVEEGRVIYNNIRKFIRYMLACNFGEVLTMFLGMLVGLPLPLLPIQILWVNLVTDGLPAIALGLDPPEKDVMYRKPRSESESIFSDGLLGLILFRGIMIGISTLAVFCSILYFSDSITSARTGAFVTLVLTQLIHVFECKSEQKSLFEIPVWNNPALMGAVFCSLLMILAVIYVPVLQGVFKTVPLGFTDWTLISGISVLGPGIAGFFRHGKSEKRKR